MIRRPPRSTQSRSSAASDVYKRQARILGVNAQYYLKEGGGFVISIKANCIDSTAPAPQVFAAEVAKMKGLGLKPKEQVTLEPFERDHAVVCGTYKPVTN
eukprot:TRINITY_DN1616_c0_g1_i5.p1 TRINITY_DN1616_c0_g1~~TRINITY_DN1616_c0_g1_i5.p1  ORF type:complete len:100 (+),score=59.73 TRINITY_DN1616_c0_g1_i5:137-436(+)